MCGVYPDLDASSTTYAGDEISSTYEGRHLTMREDELIHPDRTSDFVNKGDPVIITYIDTPGVAGQAVGVALATATAETDLIAVDTEGIWRLYVYADNDDGACIVYPGDPLFIAKSPVTSAPAGGGTGAGAISKVTNLATQIPFGYAMGYIGSGLEGTIAVKVHFDPNYDVSAQIWKTIQVASPGTYAAAMKLIVDSDIAQTGTRMCALSVNMEPGAYAAQAITGAEICTYLGGAVTVAGMLTGLFVETQGGLSYASDVYSLYVYLAVAADPAGSCHVARFENNSATATWVESFACFVGNATHLFDLGPVASCDAWDYADPATGSITGHIKISMGAVATERYIATYSAH